MKKVDFEFQTKYGIFRDALYVDDLITDEEIQNIKLERLNNWMCVVENPPIQESETIEIDGVIYEKIEIDGQIVLKPVGV